MPVALPSSLMAMSEKSSAWFVMITLASSAFLLAFTTKQLLKKGQALFMQVSLEEDIFSQCLFSGYSAGSLLSPVSEPTAHFAKDSSRSWSSSAMSSGFFKIVLAFLRQA